MASTTTATTATEQDGVSLYPTNLKGKKATPPFVALLFEGEEGCREDDEGDVLSPFLVALRKKEEGLCHSSYALCPCEEHWKLATSTPIVSPFGYVKVLLAVMSSRFGVGSFRCHIYMVLNDNESDNVNKWDKVHMSVFSSEEDIPPEHGLMGMLGDLVSEL